MSVAYETPQPSNQHDAQIPTQTSENLNESARLHNVLRLFTHPKREASSSELEKARPTPEPLDGKELDILKTRLDHSDDISGVRVLISIYELLGLMPDEEDAAGHDERISVISELSEVDKFYNDCFFITESQSSSVPRIDRDLCSDLLDETEGASNPVIGTITNAQHSGSISNKYRNQLIVADRLARIIYLDAQKV